jgi:hypothetical protein
MTVRLTAPRPAEYDLAALHAEARAVAAGCRAVNEVAPDLIAAYWPDGSAPDVSVWEAVVAGHVPPEPADEPDPVAALQAQVAELQAALDTLLGVTP